MKLEWWLIFSVISLVLWGISGFFMKVATFKLDPRIAFIFQSTGVLIVASMVFFSTMGILKNSLSPDLKLYIISGLLAGLTGGLGTFFLLKAYEKGNLATVTVLTALYPVISVLLGIIILKEKLTLTQIIAIILSLVAIVLFSIP
ncbi:MAG: DMT family transporter [Candidatus Calescibacterium sp.]|nr:DMT family transporter [Candidatus Calescibacterium sp.]MCX7759305.1 DMT family transporter [bacterium]